MTMRADGQFNTTIYNEDDRFRGVKGGRRVVLMNEADIVRLKLHQGDRVKLSTAVDDGVDRELGGLQVMPYDIPEKCIARLLSRMQRAHSAVALRQGEQGSGSEIDTGADHAPARGAVTEFRKRLRTAVGQIDKSNQTAV